MARSCRASLAEKRVRHHRPEALRGRIRVFPLVERLEVAQLERPNLGEIAMELERRWEREPRPRRQADGNVDLA